MNRSWKFVTILGAAGLALNIAAFAALTAFFYSGAYGSVAYAH